MTQRWRESFSSTLARGWPDSMSRQYRRYYTDRQYLWWTILNGANGDPEIHLLIYSEFQNLKYTPIELTDWNSIFVILIRFEEGFLIWSDFKTINIPVDSQPGWVTTECWCKVCNFQFQSEEILKSFLKNLKKINWLDNSGGRSNEAKSLPFRPTVQWFWHSGGAIARKRKQCF